MSIEELLKEWAVPEDVINAFKDNDVDISQLEVINSNQEYLKELCPILGTRIKLQTNIQLYLNAQATKSASAGPSYDSESTVDLTFPHDADFKILGMVEPNTHTSNSPTDFDLKTLLETSPCGLSVLQYYRNHDSLDSKRKNRLTDIIIKHLFTKIVNKRLTLDDYNIITGKIISLFPKESAGTYYTKPIKKSQSKYGKSIPARGKLVDKVRNVMFQSTERNKTESKQKDKTAAVNAILLDLHKEDIKWMEDNQEPFEEVLRKWNRTAEVRHGRDYTDVNDFLANWKILNSSKGALLIEEDFQFLYEGKEDHFALYWHDFMKGFIQLKHDEIVKDETKEALLNSMDDLDEESKIPTQIELLVSVVPPKGRSSKHGKFSAQECLNTILRIVEGISMNKFSRKILEFNAENETLSSNMSAVKAEFISKLNDIVDQMRRCQNQTMALQVRTEELTYEISELNSQNADLRKQIQTASMFQSQHVRHKIEEVEKELKDEKCKKLVLRDRLTRAECQLKAASERAVQIEAALDQARSQNWNLERTVQQLTEQNQKLQADFDTELKKLTESIKVNTSHLEEIADAREKLQFEKEDLVKRIAELSNNYEESILKMKEEIKSNIAKLIEAEKKCETEKVSRLNLEKKLEGLCSQTLETEFRCNEVLKTLQQRDEQLAQAMKKANELEATKTELNKANQEVEECKEQLTKQNDTIREIERNFKETIELEKSLKSDIVEKEEYIAALEKKDYILEQQMRENEQKMNSYVQQLNALKEHIEELQRDFGEFENLGQLHDMINEQRDNLNEVVKEKAELIEMLQNKNAEIEQHLEHVSELENALDDKDGEIKMMAKKEEEQSNIVKLLRNNMEIRAQADNEIRNQLAEKNAEIESLEANLDTRKQQITELEKIILTLEDQLRKVNFRRRKDQEKMTLLEKALTEYETYHMTAKKNKENSVENLDTLIKVLEDELGTTYQSKLKDQEYRNIQISPKFIGDVNTEENNIVFQKGHKLPTKIVMGNFVKRTYLATNDESQNVDNLDRKKAITQMEPQKMMSALEPAADRGPAAKFNLAGLVTMPPAYARDHLLLKNLHQFTAANQLREEKKCKMFKLAGHRL